MIKVVDYCDPPAFAPVELDAFVCYVRMFLEAIFKQNHEHVEVSIHIKEQSDALFKDTGGFTNQTGVNEFEIVVFKNIRKKIITAVSHELVHVKQHMEDGFFVDRKTNQIFWEDKYYMSLSDLVRMHREKQEELYRMLPWEFDAQLIVLAVLELVSTKFHKLCKNKAEMNAYLEKALTESDYIIY